MPSSCIVVHLTRLAGLVSLAGCTTLFGEPVPPHPPLEATWLQVLEQRPIGVQSFEVSERDVVYGGRERWGITRESALVLSNAARPSEVAAAWGAFVPTCANCHAGDRPQLPIETGHGGAYRLLLEGVRVADPGLRQRALEQARGAPDLGPSRERILQLFDRIADHEDPSVHSQALGALQHECWQCHGRDGLIPR